ncbi:hypothetical protein ACTG9Q_16015 [Actinokineospora sp. 24-640]
MTHVLPDLDDRRTKAAMLRELDADERGPGIYRSTRLTSAGHAAWTRLLRTALGEHDPGWLHERIALPTYWLSHEQYVQNGMTRTRKVPGNAAQVHAESEFIKYYCRGLAVRSLDERRGLRFARLKQVRTPRPTSEALIGTTVDPAKLLADLRSGDGPSIRGLLPGPGSGIGVVLH